MTDVQTDRAEYRRARDLEWIESRYIGGSDLRPALHRGPQAEGPGRAHERQRTQGKPWRVRAPQRR